MLLLLISKEEDVGSGCCSHSPLNETHSRALIEGGAGNAATQYESLKRAKYKDLDMTKYIFVPFIVETSGAMGDSARDLCAQIQEIRESRTPSWIAGKKNDPSSLQRSLNIELQRQNSSMLVDREVNNEELRILEHVKSDFVLIRKKKAIAQELRKSLMKPLSVKDIQRRKPPDPGIPFHEFVALDPGLIQTEAITP